MSDDRDRSFRRWAGGSLAWTILVSAGLIVLPFGRTQTSEASSSGEVESESGWVTLLESQGLSVLPILLVPIVVPALALLSGPSRRAVVIGLGVLYLGLVILGLASIGVFYLPAAVALVVAGSAARRPDAVRPG